MGRSWTERKYCSAENLWFWIDEQSGDIDIKLASYKDSAGDSYKLLLMGRREMLDWICDWLHENETTLGEVAENWGLKTDDQDT
jgi:hypothetical protein